MRHTNQSPGTTGSVLENAAQIERALIRAEFQRQPARVQTETIERILSILVDEYRRRPNVHSALWHRMDIYGFTVNIVRLTAEGLGGDGVATAQAGVGNSYTRPGL